MFEVLRSVGDSLYQNIIYDGRYWYYIDGLWVTLRITFGACVLGIILGLVIAVIRVWASESKSAALRIANAVCRAYLAVIRGTPVMVQLLIFAFVIFGTSPLSRIWVAIIALGINSGAYSSETIRAGILAVDKGQSEAGRSLGLSMFDTYRFIILPQAFKNVLPPLGNEVIMLLKETAIVSAVAINDLTRAYSKISNQTYEFFIPLFTITFIYFIIVMLMTFGLKHLERWLRKSDNR